MSIRSLAAGAAIGATLATAVGIAYASIPDSNGIIHAARNVLVAGDVRSPPSPASMPPRGPP
jgi:hypothetical protein